MTWDAQSDGLIVLIADRCMRLVCFIVLATVFPGCIGNPRKSTHLGHVNETYELKPEELVALKRAADFGSADAALRLASYCLFITFDFDEGFRYHEIAAKRGDPTTLYNHGFLLSELKGDRREALKWLEKAEQKGSREARSLTEVIRKKGEGAGEE
ncbi:MAG: hypothetical protein ABMA01_05570 [Chthoniobacteraceae bacterium]